MTPEIRNWQIRLLIILLVGGCISYFLHTWVLGGLFGFSGSSSFGISLASSISFALLGFLFEALPVAWLARPKSSANTVLQNRWGRGYLLSWLSMTLTMMLISSGLHLLLTTSEQGGAMASNRWTYLGIHLMANVAGSYVFFFVLNLRFAQTDWSSHWQEAVWILAGGNVVLSVLLSFITTGGGQFSIMAPGIVGQMMLAAIMAWALGTWRKGVETHGPSAGITVF